MTGRADPRGRRRSVTATNECPTGKHAHATRAGAKAHALSLRVTEGEHVRPYQCDECLQWHVGHLPSAVIDGRVDADTYYGRSQRQDPA